MYAPMWAENWKLRYFFLVFLVVVCLLPDKARQTGSLNVIGQFWVPFRSESFSTGSVFTAKPTPASRISLVLRPHRSIYSQTCV